MKSIRQKTINILPKKVKLFLSAIKLIIRKPRLIAHANKQYKQTSKPIYLLSFPRGGSSWVGSVLGMAKNVRYLREPITTAFFYHKKQSASVFSEAQCENWARYSNLITKALNAQLFLIDKVIPFPTQWQQPKESKTTVIKEVNPLIIKELVQHDINLAYLIRHPFSVAKSYKALGWNKANQFATRFSNQEIQLLLEKYPALLKKDYFYQIGFLQGFIEAKCRSESLDPIVYESLVENPLSEFSILFDKYHLEFDDVIKTHIKKTLSHSKPVTPGDFGLVRQQKELCSIKVSPKELNDFTSTMQGYHAGFIHESPNRIAVYLKQIKVEYVDFEVGK